MLRERDDLTEEVDVTAVSVALVSYHQESTPSDSTTLCPQCLANIVGCLTAFLGDQRIGLNFNNLVTLPACSDDDVAGGALQIVVRPWAGDPSTAHAWIRTLRVRALPPPKEMEEPPSFYGMYGFYGMRMN